MTMRIGIVGGGAMGRRYLDAYQFDPRAEIVSVCDLDGDRAHRLAGEYGVNSSTSVEEMLSGGRFDAVVVATPDFSHLDPVLACLGAGVHVLCEKPLATTVSDAMEMVVAARASPGQLMVNFGNRHRPAARRARALVREGRIGAVRYAHLCLNEKSAKTATLAWSEQTSELWFLISHLADFVQWFLDDHVRSVYASRGHDASGASTTVAILNFASAATVTLESSWNMPAHLQRDVDLRLAVHGADGVIELDMGDQGLVVSDGRRAATVQWDSTAGGSAEDWWDRSCRYFTERISGRMPVEPDAVAGLENVLVLSALQRSLDSGSVVTVAEHWPEAAALLY